MRFRPLDIQKLNIKLSGSDNKAAQLAGEVVRVVRRMNVGFCPGADRQLFETLLEKENQEILKKRRNLIY